MPTGVQRVVKRFFISHASADKPFALELKEALKGDAWIDLHEIDLGDILLEEISDGIESASDFVLLWSTHSAGSRWVRFEFHMAFIRWLEDKAVALRVVRLDAEPVPLYLRPFLQERNAKSAVEVAAALHATAAAVTRRPFINRNSQIGRIEDALHSPSLSSVWICGMPGVGKRSLANESLQRITLGASAFKRITITAGVAEPELDLLVASALGTEDPDVPEFRDYMVRTMGRLKQFASSGGVWVFENAEHWLEDDGTPNRIALAVDEALTPSAGDYTGRLAIFTSRRRPQIDPPMSPRTETLFLTGLSREHAIPVLRAHGGHGTDEELGVVATELDGHPLALEVVAPQLPLDPSALSEQRYSIATDLIDPARMAPTTWRLLEVLALVDGPLAAEDIASILELTSEQFQAAVAEASALALAELDDLGNLSLHPLLRDYYLRSYRRQPDHEVRTAQLADVVLARFQTLAPGTREYVQSLFATMRILALANRFEDARALRGGLIGTLLASATELYQEKRYDEALMYADEALTGNDRVDRDTLLLKAKTLAYLGRLDDARRLGDALVAAEPTSPKVLRDRGRIEFVARDWPTAIRYFERAIPLRRNNAQLWADIAQARARMEDWDGASAAAKMAIDAGGDTPYALSLYSQALEKQGDFATAAEMMARAVKREPANSAYHHRLGRIHQQTGNRELAIAEFEASVTIDPGFVDSWLSLASIRADAHDFDGAAAALARASAIKGAPLEVVENVRAKLALLQDDLEGARASVSAALRRRRDARNLALAIRVEIAWGEAGRLAVGQVRANVRLMAKELDALGHLVDVLELSALYPQYF